jgi:hypothetical protein
MKVLKLIMYTAFAGVLTASLGLAAAIHFKAALEGKVEVPAIKSDAKGDAVFTLSADGKEITYELNVKNIENVTAAHIQAGKFGAQGKVVVGLFAGPKKEGKFSGELVKGTITHKNLVGPLAGKTIADLVTMMEKGNAYVNVHTTKYPKGEIRGQIYYMP